MKKLLDKYHRYHLVGVAGNGMSAIARCLLKLQREVSGSDVIRNTTTERLKDMGADISQGHSKVIDSKVDCLVLSSAIGEENEEVSQAAKLDIPILHRSDVLTALLDLFVGVGVSGSHGKTTTCALLIEILITAGYEPSYALGAALRSTGVNADIHNNKYFIGELDESDGSFLKSKPIYSVITNLDEDHMETYDFSKQKLRQAFIDFANQSEKVFLGVDDENIRALVPEISVDSVTFGLCAPADVMAKNVKAIGLRMYFEALGEEFILNLLGEHNVKNALAAIAVAYELGVSPASMTIALENFQGLARRADIVEDFLFQNKRIVFAHDYGHHPVEIEAMIQSLDGAFPEQRIVMVFQPHRYTRTRDLMDQFATVLAQVDRLILLDVYEASEEKIEGATSKDLFEKIGINEKSYVQPDEVMLLLAGELGDDDVLLFQGAGDFFGLLERFQ